MFVEGLEDRLKGLQEWINKLLILVFLLPDSVFSLDKGFGPRQNVGTWIKVD